MLHECVRRFDLMGTTGKFLRTKQGLNRVPLIFSTIFFFTSVVTGFVFCSGAGLPAMNETAVLEGA